MKGVDYFQLREGLGYELGTDYGFDNIKQEREELDISKLDYSIKDDNGHRVPLSWIAVDDIEECIGSFCDDLKMKMPDEILEYIARLEMGKNVGEYSISQQNSVITKSISNKNINYLQNTAGVKHKNYSFIKTNKPVILNFD